MSESEMYTSDSSSDEEHEQGLIETEILQQRDEALDDLWELFKEKNIESKINGLIDGYVVNDWLRGSVSMEDVVVYGKLKKLNSSIPYGNISDERIDDFRQAACAVVNFYKPCFSKYKQYINDVTASIIKYHYKL